MALYEIRTMLTQHRTSLVSYGDFPSDAAAILGATDMVRPGEFVEVMRGENLVYKSGLRKAFAGTTVSNDLLSEGPPRLDARSPEGQ